MSRRGAVEVRLIGSIKALLRRFAHQHGFGQLAVMVGGMQGDLRMRVTRRTDACKETYEPWGSAFAM